jgi:hypothetical protein
MNYVPSELEHVICFSGGICSYIAAKRVVEATGRDGTILLYCDTRAEDEDTERFLTQAKQFLKLPLVRIEDGRTPWEVFECEKMLGNSRADPCSRILKRQLTRRWLNDHCNPNRTTVYLGLSWYEKHRIEKNRKAWHPWTTDYPACRPPLLELDDMLATAVADKIAPPRLYALGFQHNNCGGFCIKQGHAAMRHFLAQFPRKFAEHEAREQKFRATTGKNVTIMLDLSPRRGLPITLREFRLRCETLAKPHPAEDWHDCACMLVADGDEHEENA